MKPEFTFPKTPYDVFAERERVSKNDMFEDQGGVAYRHVPFDPSQFCLFAENSDGTHWECPNCGRKIDKAKTFGNKPIVVCANPAKELAVNPTMVAPVKMAPAQVGGVVKRENRGASKYGVGFELKKLLLKLKIELPSACVCNSRAMLLNDKEMDEIESMRNKILSWFEDEAHKRAIYFDHDKANKILDISIRRAKKAKAKYEAKIAQEQNSNG